MRLFRDGIRAITEQQEAERGESRRKDKAKDYLAAFGRIARIRTADQDGPRMAALRCNQRLTAIAIKTAIVIVGSRESAASRPTAVR